MASRKTATMPKKTKVPDPAAPTVIKPKPKPQEVSPEQTTTDSMREIGGSTYGAWNDALLYRTYMTASRLVPAGTDPSEVNGKNAGIAGLGLRAFRPSNPVEAMIASQAVALHFASMECLRLAVANAQYPDVASKLRKDAANTSRAMVEMCEALDRRRGKGPQTIRVERVVVQDGGQAVVAGTVMTGTLPPGTALPTSEATPQAISQNASPMSIVDVVPVEARGRGGE